MKKKVMEEGCLVEGGDEEGDEFVTCEGDGEK